MDMRTIVGFNMYGAESKEKVRRLPRDLWGSLADPRIGQADVGELSARMSVYNDPGLEEHFLGERGTNMVEDSSWRPYDVVRGADGAEIPFDILEFDALGSVGKRPGG